MQRTDMCPNPRCKRLVTFTISISTEHNELYVTAHGVCSGCGNSYDAYGFSNDHPLAVKRPQKKVKRIGDYKYIG